MNVDDLGQKLYEEYIIESINGDVSLWAPVKKQNNKVYMSGSKKQTVKISDQTVDLRETKNLYGRLMILTRLYWDIGQKNAVGNAELTLTPRALFAPDASMFPCTDKYKLIHNLVKLPNTDETNEQTETAAADKQDDDDDRDAFVTSSTNPKIAVVDGIVLVQKMTLKKDTQYSKRSRPRFK